MSSSGMEKTWKEVREMNKLYRYAAFNDHRSDRYGDLTQRGVRISLLIFDVVRSTPGGVWVKEGGWGVERWVGLHHRKAYAYDTKKKALASFKIRNSRHIGHLKTALKKAEMARDALETDDMTLFEPKIFEIATAS
jgi:hypothetical protein